MIRRLQVVVIGAILAIAAFSTGLPFLFYLLYLGLLVIGGSYVLARLGLSDLEAGYAVNQLSGHVGEQIRVTYTVRNASRIPKLFLEVHNPTSIPTGLPGRAITLGPHGERSWLVRVPLSRRGHFRIDPLVVRTGDPFGLFESAATVGEAVTVVVYPRVDRLPYFRLPPASIEGTRASQERTLQVTPLATSVRPYAPGDSFNRIHWPSTARHGDIQVKEFDLEQTADAWIFLDLESTIQGGRGEESTTEMGVRIAASIADKAIGENRAVGLTASGSHMTVLPADRGARQHSKVMDMLAAVDADGSTPLAEVLVSGTSRLRRGMTAIVITPSLAREWVRPLAGLRSRGIACAVVTLDARAYDDLWAGIHQAEAPDPDRRALRHALAEYDLPVFTMRPGRPIAEALVS